MFQTTTEISVRDNPGWGSNVLRNVPALQTLSVEGSTGVCVDGWLWHKLQGENAWVAERNAEGDQVALGWIGKQAPPTIPLLDPASTVGVPQQPAQFTHQQLLEAIRQAGGTAADDWLNRGRFTWIVNDLTAPYKGDPIINAPALTADEKKKIVTALMTVAVAKAATQQPANFTHQDLINAFYKTASVHGGDGWQLVQQAGLDYIAKNRKEIYSGTPIPNLNLSEAIKATLITELGATVPATTEMTASFKSEPAAQLTPFSVSGNQFLYKGKPFKFVGVNLRELAYYGYPHSPITQWARPEHVDAQLDAARNMKAQVVRFYAPHNRRPDGSEGTDVQDAIKRGKVILDKLQARGMFALVTLTDAKWSGFDVFCPGQYRGPNLYIYNNDWYREGYKGTYINFVKEYVGALGNHPAIFAWAIGNEMQTYLPDISDSMGKAFIDFFKVASELIRKLSPTKLITTGVECSWSLFVDNAYGGGKYTNKLYALPNIDFATLHTYQHTEIRDNLGHNDERIYAEVVLAKKVWKKPYIMEEIGPTGGHHRGDGGIWIRSASQRLFDMGFSGVMQWGYSALPNDIGAGDGDSGMHMPGSQLPGHDWDSMFKAYQDFGKQFWA